MAQTKHKEIIDKFEIVSALYLLLIFLFALFTAALGNHTLFLVFVGFMPTIITVIISLLIHEQYKRHRHLLWIVPLVVMTGFFLLKNNPIFATMDIEVLTGVNFLLSMLYVIFTFMLFTSYEEKIVIESMVNLEPQATKEEEKEKKDIREYIHSIEDKSKAINFVIGRVYNIYHGGSKGMRQNLQIPADWYNEFSLLGFTDGNIDQDRLMDLIRKIETQLSKLELTEKEVFKNNVHSLKNLIREPHGNDKILEVLDHNDKDPLRSYYEGAIDFCKKVREEMGNMELSIIKNEYIPKTDDEAAELENQAPTKSNKNKKNTSKEMHNNNNDNNNITSSKYEHVISKKKISKHP